MAQKFGVLTLLEEDPSSHPSTQMSVTASYNSPPGDLIPFLISEGAAHMWCSTYLQANTHTHVAV